MNENIVKYLIVVLLMTTKKYSDGCPAKTSIILGFIYTTIAYALWIGLRLLVNKIKD